MAGTATDYAMIAHILKKARRVICDFKLVTSSQWAHPAPGCSGNSCQARGLAVLTCTHTANYYVAPRRLLPSVLGRTPNGGSRRLQPDNAARRARHCIRIMTNNAPSKAVPATVHGDGASLHYYTISAVGGVRHFSPPRWAMLEDAPRATIQAGDKRPWPVPPPSMTS